LLHFRVRGRSLRGLARSKLVSTACPTCRCSRRPHLILTGILLLVARGGLPRARSSLPGTVSFADAAAAERRYVGQAANSRVLEMFSCRVIWGTDRSRCRANRRSRCRSERSLGMLACSCCRAVVASGDAFWLFARKLAALTLASGRASLLPPPGALVASGVLELSRASMRAPLSRCLQPRRLLNLRVRVPFVARLRSLQAHFTRMPNKPLQRTTATRCHPPCPACRPW
jgi:hypothetical protein